MMKLGSKTTCRLNQGGKIRVSLDDRVHIDGSMNQWEAGWWVNVGTLEDSTFFLSDSGILYGLDVSVERESYTVPIGICVPMAKQAKAYDKMIDALFQDELDNGGNV